MDAAEPPGPRRTRYAGSRAASSLGARPPLRAAGSPRTLQLPSEPTELGRGCWGLTPPSGDCPGSVHRSPEEDGTPAPGARERHRSSRSCPGPEGKSGLHPAWRNDGRRCLPESSREPGAASQQGRAGPRFILRISAALSFFFSFFFFTVSMGRISC